MSLSIEQKTYREVVRVRELLEQTPLPQEWVPEKQAMAMLGIKIDMIRKLRYQGRLKFRCRVSGRGFQYHIKSIEALMI